MARDVIDELSLKIDIDVDKGASKTISSLARAITKLNTAVASVGDLHRYVRTLNKLDAKSINVRTSTGVGKASGKYVPPQYQDAPEQQAKQGDLPTIAKNGNKAAEAVKNLGKESKKTKKELKDLDKNADKSSSTFKKLVRSIGRIAFYRAIRLALNQIAKGAVQGLENIRQMDGALDKSLKNLSLSQTSLYNSLATLLSPIIKTIEPVITKLSDSIARIANRINEAQAALKGQTTYTKILTSDTKEWNEQLKKAQGTLLSFDKFEALNPQKDGYIGTIEEQVVMSQEEAQGVVSKFEKILDLVVSIGFAVALISFAKVIIDLGGIVKTLGTILSFVGKNLISLSGILGVVVGIYSVIDGIKSISNWDEDTTSLQKFADVARVLFGVLAAIAGVIAIIKGKTIVGGIAAALAVVATIGSIVAGVASHAEKTKKFADGGTFEKGTHFIAGEAGAEVVYNSHTGSGAGGVANIEQISQAQYIATMNAIQDSGILDAINNVGGDVVMDGRKVGQIVTKTVHDEGVRVGYFKRA